MTLEVASNRLQPILETVRASSRSAASSIHGEAHWRRVAALGLALAAEDARVDRDVVVLFGMTHDAMRVDDGLDPEHGPRAAALLRRLGGPLLELDDDRLERLAAAVAGHSRGETSTDPTIGACWDADRLDLLRLGRDPIPELLSTPMARAPLLQLGARAILAQPPGWAAIFAGASGSRDDDRTRLRGKDTLFGEAGYCERCHVDIPRGPDACLGHIEGVIYACCGHGRVDGLPPYVVVLDSWPFPPAFVPLVTFRSWTGQGRAKWLIGPDALRFFEQMGVGPAEYATADRALTPS